MKLTVAELRVIMAALASPSVADPVAADLYYRVEREIAAKSSKGSRA